MEKIQKTQDKIIMNSKSQEEEALTKKVKWFFFYSISKFKLSYFMNENSNLKSNIREFQEKIRINEKNSIRQNEYYVKIEQKYRELLQKFASKNIDDPEKEKNSPQKSRNKSNNHSSINDVELEVYKYC